MMATNATGAIRLPDVPQGEVARVVEIDASAADWREHLQAYGLAPGGTLTVVQHSPVTVVRVNRTDLAFERRIAQGILVSTSTPPGQAVGGSLNSRWPGSRSARTIVFGERD